MGFQAKRCGVQFNPPSIVLVYIHTDTNKIRKRIIPIRNFFKHSDCSTAAERLKNHPRHRGYLDQVPLHQLEKLHIVLRDHMQGLSLENSLASFQLDPDEDLNKLEDEELARKKGQMDTLFERNRKRKDDPDFVYDLEVEFDKSKEEKCSWDEESDEDI
ncbi:centrosomal protein of 19 kDa [Xiphophorus maculatus]|uniref:Centrosomal protein of 19 kDa n=1 Tax=Xiphophorus maculatus TaxID=8083 RepID=M4AA03_XIPMA|nr:centrosomal protein of 19 kDa [Xiphophorus maculatus]